VRFIVLFLAVPSDTPVGETQIVFFVLQEEPRLVPQQTPLQSLLALFPSQTPQPSNARMGGC